MSVLLRSRLADKAVNRSFLIDPKGEIPARYDKIHMFDVDLANGESYRESRKYRPASSRRWPTCPGPLRPDDLLRPALSCALSRACGSRRIVPHSSCGFHAPDRRSALACAVTRARDRERLFRVRRGSRRQARERPRDIRPFAGDRSVGPHHRRRRHRARNDHGRDRSVSGRRSACAHTLAATRPPLRNPRAHGGADASCTWSRSA